MKGPALASIDYATGDLAAMPEDEFALQNQAVTPHATPYEPAPYEPTTDGPATMQTAPTNQGCASGSCAAAGVYSGGYGATRGYGYGGPVRRAGARAFGFFRNHRPVRRVLFAPVRLLGRAFGRGGC